MKQLLLLHGALATKHQFDQFLPLLKDTFNAEAINFTGHGGFSIPTQGYHFNQFAEDILKYADQQKIEKINLFGFSMGGYAALYFAKLYPERVNRIFTMNVKFNWDIAGTARETAMLDAEKMVTKVPGYANQLMMQHGLNMWKQVIDQTSKLMNNLAKDLVLLDSDFEKMNSPVLLGVGDRDITAGVEDTLHVFRKLPAGQFMVFPNTAHPFEKLNMKLLAEMAETFFM